MLHDATAEQLLAIVEIALNIIKNRFPLSNHQRERLMPYAAFVRKLARARRERSARKIVQSGGGAMLASLLAPVLLEIGRSLINGS